MADITASPAMRSPGPAPSSRPFTVLAVLLSGFLLLSSSCCYRPTNAAATAATAATGDAVRHVRHKRTVSDLVEGLMNAMYYHSDPEPVQSTVIARITHLPATKVYKYVPVQTVKLSKLRARQIAEPKFKIKYPKKYSIKTEDSSLTVVKNDLPWTLHPLPPPLPTAKTVKLEVDKSMPWALHPLPPPVRTKSYAEYYWPDPKTRPPKYTGHRNRPAHRPHHRFRPDRNKYLVKTKRPSSVVYKSVGGHGRPAAVDYGHDDDYNHVDDKRPADYNKPDGFKYDEHGGSDNEYNNNNSNGHNSNGHNNDDNDNNNNINNNNNYNNEMPDDYKSHEIDKHVEFGPVDFKQIDFKHVDYKHVDYKSPDYKTDFKMTDFPKHGDDEHHGGGGDDDHDVFRHSFAHDDHGSHLHDDVPSQPPSSADFVSHITIEPSIQIAAFSDTELQGDGSSSSGVSHADDGRQRQKCQCTVNGHRHRRHADDVANASAAAAATTSTAAAAAAPTAAVVSRGKSADLDGSRSTPRAYFGPGHATEVQIVRSHDISDGAVPTYAKRDMGAAEPWRPVAAGGHGGREEPKKSDAVFRDESDKFRVDLWDEPRPSSAADRGQPSSSSSSSSLAAAAASTASSTDSGENVGQDRGKNYHIITTVTKTSNKAGGDDDGLQGVGFSVQTPFSVSSFSSNVRHPLTEERLRFTSSSSPLSSSPLSSSFRQSEYSAPLDFEQFGFKSALTDDRPLGSAGGRLTSGFSDDASSDVFSGRLGSHFSRDFGDDRRRGPLKSSRPFRYRSQSASDLFDDRFAGSRASSSDDSVLEYFQPVVIDFDRNKSKDDKNAKSFRYNNNNNNGGGGGGNDKLRYFGKADPAGFSKFKRNQNSDPLRLPGGLHESTENLSRKMIFHPSTFDTDQ